ncbi:MAG: hypothetical protein RMX65_015645 [Nostoc sp. DedQUE01]|nr:hypothetical protein [Nostoc sp. DedQUE11]MDZ8073806.1 hypothetical protein [Nostoc sp. DedQUE01]
MQPTISSLFNRNQVMAMPTAGYAYAVVKPSSCLTTGIESYLNHL